MKILVAYYSKSGTAADGANILKKDLAAANGVLFALFYPVLTGVSIPRDYAWNVLKWLPDWPF